MLAVKSSMALNKAKRARKSAKKREIKEYKTDRSAFFLGSSCFVNLSVESFKNSFQEPVGSVHAGTALGRRLSATTERVLRCFIHRIV